MLVNVSIFSSFWVLHTFLHSTYTISLLCPLLVFLLPWCHILDFFRRFLDSVCPSKDSLWMSLHLLLIQYFCFFLTNVCLLPSYIILTLHYFPEKRKLYWILKKAILGHSKSDLMWKMFCQISILGFNHLEHILGEFHIFPTQYSTFLKPNLC